MALRLACIASQRRPPSTAASSCFPMRIRSIQHGNKFIGPAMTPIFIRGPVAHFRTSPVAFKKGGKEQKGGKKGGKGDEESTGPLELDLDDVEKRMKSAIDALKTDLSNIKVGRATPTLLDKVMVTIGNQTSPLLQLATVSVKDPQHLLVNVFAPDYTMAVRDAIAKAGLNLNPQVETNGIKVPIPKATQEHRQSLVKQAHKRSEDAKLQLRNIRQDALKELKSIEKTQSKDYVKRTEKKIQEFTDKHVKEVEVAHQHKEKEINSF